MRNVLCSALVGILTKALFYCALYKVDGSNEDSKVLTSFTPKPVFRIEDTDGDLLDYENVEMPQLPLLERAEEWGLSVKAIPGNYKYYGYYSSDKKEIGRASPDESVLFHEYSSSR